jgi:sulfite reductase (NADPH) flavoprotein alpha-component
MAFLQERTATGATGKNWLFFGDQRKSLDFLYEDRLLNYLATGLLHRLDTAFSRDENEKIYVQQRMLEQANELWKWLEDGAHFYVCGDALRMALDVERTLLEVIATQGSLSTEAARDYLNAMTQSRRYVRDVY